MSFNVQNNITVKSDNGVQQKLASFDGKNTKPDFLFDSEINCNESNSDNFVSSTSKEYNYDDVDGKDGVDGKNGVDGKDNNISADAKFEDKEKNFQEKIKKQLSDIAGELGLNGEFAEAWVNNSLTKAQLVKDNVYDDCINNLKKSPERAKVVSDIAFEVALNEIIKNTRETMKKSHV